MKLRISIFVFLLFCFALKNISCVSSEETGAGDRARKPIQMFSSIDTTRRWIKKEVSSDTIISLKEDTLKVAEKKQERIPPKFKTKQDTLQASLVTKKKNVQKLDIQIERPENPFYTVQIGAFSKVSNALLAHKKAKDRFVNQPVFNNYVKSANIYRVSVGRYQERKDAFSLRDTIRQLHPNEYSQCWINYIP